MHTIISVDIEIDGSVPILNSMLQLGAVALNMKGEELSHFCLNLKPLPHARPDVSTMKWWSQQDQKIWAMVTKDPREPEEVISCFHKWCCQFSKARFFAAPVTYDLGFLRCYLRMFHYNLAMYHNALDMRSVVFALTGKFEGDWRMLVSSLTGCHPKNPTPHFALEDAREQAEYLFSLLRWAENKGGPRFTEL